MLNIRASTADVPSDYFAEDPRKVDESNLSWLGRNLDRRDAIQILMVGGTGPADLRLRVAQSHLRHDMTPSRWSHMGLLGELPDDPSNATVYEIALEPRNGFGFAAPENAVQEGRLDAYADRWRFPNLALITVPVPSRALPVELKKFKLQRAVLDATELVLVWLAFLWGVGRTGNPLFDSNGVPSAALVEVIVGSLGYELTPGLESRASCPEAVWQAARWWKDFYAKQKREPLRGVWTASHVLVS